MRHQVVSDERRQVLMRGTSRGDGSTDDGREPNVCLPTYRFLMVGSARQIERSCRKL